jgi:hypothetical protein
VDVDPIVELDKPWTAIVLQNVPGDALRSALNSGPDALTREFASQNGILMEEVKDVRVLCNAEGLQSRDFLSVRLMVSNEQTATQMICNGAFAFSAFCRTVPYRQKPRQRRSQ